jgi:Flp pilus assembly protein TadD
MSKAGLPARDGWTEALLAGLVLAVYGRVCVYEFAGYDDIGYVSANPIVGRGITSEGIRWAFTTGHMWNWHPLTWLSHMLDVQMFGLTPGAHHLVNVALHLANTLLLFTILRRWTGERWASFVVAALFAVHPLHVESVAWISERKDVLSTFFFLLTLAAHGRWAATHSPRWYAAGLAAFALGLMSKPMLVTLPFLLLLLDHWPLRRAAMPGALVLEKLPHFALAAAISVITYRVQLEQGAVDAAGTLPLTLRLGNAVVSYGRYLLATAWPVDLAIFYPYEIDLPGWRVAVSALGLAAISGLVLRAARRRPYALVGWLWYLGTLVPVIGLVQAGSQSHADRFTYIPLIGLFVMLAWGGRDAVTRFSVPAAVLVPAVTGVITACAVTASTQVGVWRTSETLFAHAVRVTRRNHVAHNNLGVALQARGDLDGAIEHYREAVRIQPEYAHARTNLGKALRGRFEQAVARNPRDPVAQFNLAVALHDAGELDAAIGHYEEAVRLAPANESVHLRLGAAFFASDRLAEAITEFTEAARLAPDDPTAHFNLGGALGRTGRFTEAVDEYDHVVRLKPEDAAAWANLAISHANLGHVAEAVVAHDKALELARAHRDWGLVRMLEETRSSWRTPGNGPAS